MDSALLTPSFIDAEQNLLGAIILEPDRLPDVRALIGADDFGHRVKLKLAHTAKGPGHLAIPEAFYSLPFHRRGGPCKGRRVKPGRLQPSTGSDDCTYRRVPLHAFRRPISHALEIGNRV